MCRSGCARCLVTSPGQKRRPGGSGALLRILRTTSNAFARLRWNPPSAAGAVDTPTSASAASISRWSSGAGRQAGGHRTVLSRLSSKDRRGSLPSSNDRRCRGPRSFGSIFFFLAPRPAQTALLTWCRPAKKPRGEAIRSCVCRCHDAAVADGTESGADWRGGAGEGIRTLDFNLGKVALYP
jgi:hypothetical protein